MEDTLKKFNAARNAALRTKMYVDGFYAGSLRVMSAAFIYNCVMFNMDGTILHVGNIKGINQVPSVIADAHADETVRAEKIPTLCDSHNLKRWNDCRSAEVAAYKESHK